VTLLEQYGYITMFSGVFPWLVIASLANNIMELKSDAFKYCYVYKRPFPKPTNLDPWRLAFEMFGLVSCCTNVALIALHDDVRSYFSALSEIQYIFLFIGIEVRNANITKKIQ
jgi:anoctamin-8